MIKKLFVLCFLFSLMLNVFYLDKFLALERALYIYNKVESFYSDKKFYPNNIALLGLEFSKINEHDLSSCQFWDANIPGIGKCYYQAKEQEFEFIVKSNFNSFEILLYKENGSFFRNPCLSCY